MLKELSVFAYDQYVASPWKNGQGVTREIGRYPANDAEFIWRLSLADVTQSGKFSNFEGYERTIVLLDGKGFSLDFENGNIKHLDQTYEPFVFDGGDSLTCKLLGGASRDLNLMTHRERVNASWSVYDLNSPLDLELKKENTHLLFCFTGGFQIKSSNFEPQELKVWDSAKILCDTSEQLLIIPNVPSKIFHIEIRIRN